MRVSVVVLVLAMLAGVRGWAQAGPPFQTDDPTPVDLHHYEAYVFGQMDSTPVVQGAIGPAFEFNWGAVPTIQLHAILPFVVSVPTNKKVYDPAGQGPQAFGLGDMEVGVKWGFIKQTKHRPQIGSFTMAELPTGSYSDGLSVGKAWFKLPLWAEKEFGKYSLVGGGGYALLRQVDYRSYPYAGVLLKREFSERLELAAEVFGHGAEGIAAAQTKPSTMVDAGGYYHFKAPGWQLLFSYGHSVWGQTENYGYLGLYKTWGKGPDGPEEEHKAEDAMVSHGPMRRAVN